jgi:diacylglycerol kinase (ATP)
MSSPNNDPIRHVMFATGHSLSGLKAAFRNELAFRLEILTFVVFFPLAFLLGRTAVECALLVFSLFSILIIELINSAIESVVDRIGPEFHELSGRAKDMGSAAVLIVLLGAGAVWGIIGWERFFG